MSTSIYRGKGRDDKLTKTTVVLPTDIVNQMDRIVADRKFYNQGFNRSALIELALRTFLAKLDHA